MSKRTKKIQTNIRCNYPFQLESCLNSQTHTSTNTQRHLCEFFGTAHHKTQTRSDALQLEYTFKLNATSFFRVEVDFALLTKNQSLLIKSCSEM